MPVFFIQSLALLFIDHRSASSGIVARFDDSFACVFTFEQADEGFRHLLKTIEDRFFEFQFTLHVGAREREEDRTSHPSKHYFVNQRNQLVESNVEFTMETWNDEATHSQFMPKDVDVDLWNCPTNDSMPKSSRLDLHLAWSASL